MSRRWIVCQPAFSSQTDRGIDRSKWRKPAEEMERAACVLAVGKSFQQKPIAA